MFQKLSLNHNRKSYFPQYITKKDFDFFAEYHDVFCVSIYVSPQEKGNGLINKVLNAFRKQFNIPTNELNHQGLNEKRVSLELRNQNHFISEWEKLESKESLIVFISSEITEIFLSKTETPFYVYINDHFYLKPVTSEFNPTNDLESVLKTEHFETELDQIIREAEKGNIKAVILKKHQDVYGEYDQKNDFVLLGNQENKNSISNLIAVKTILNEGSVYLLPENEMPEKGIPIMALINK